VLFSGVPNKPACVIDNTNILGAGRKPVNLKSLIYVRKVVGMSYNDNERRATPSW
jgi:hypothetical protein